VARNGVVDTSTANVAGLLYYSNTVYHVNSGGNWYSMTSSGWVGGSLAPPAPNYATGYFYSRNGQMYDPNGNEWFGRGVNIQDGTVDPSTGAPFLTTLPGLNIVRLPVGAYDDPTHFDALVDALTQHGVVVIIENHQNFNADGSSAGDAGGSQGVIFTGSLLSTETTWYTNVASHFKSNPYVWFGTNNEPSENDPNGGFDPAGLSSWQQTTYNAIRDTGNTAPILVEAMCDGNYVNGVVNNGMTVSTYQQMTNIVWDFHIYNWIFNMIDNFNEQQSGVNSIIHLLQTNWPSLDGTPAVFCGEYGPSTQDQMPLDTGGMTLVQVVESVTGNGNGLCGSCAWNFFMLWPGAGDYVTASDGSLSNPYGTTVAAWIQSSASQSGGGGTAPTISAILQAGSGGSITDSAGNTWTITSGGQIAVNEATDTSTSGVVELAYVGGIMWQEV
jgi:hypothetical protein